MRTDAGHRTRHDLCIPVGRSRMRAFVQLVGGAVLGLGLAAAVGPDPGLLFAGYTVGMGLTVLCLGLLLAEDPDAAVNRRNRSCPRHR